MLVRGAVIANQLKYLVLGGPPVNLSEEFQPLGMTVTQLAPGSAMWVSRSHGVSVNSITLATLIVRIRWLLISLGQQVADSFIKCAALHQRFGFSDISARLQACQGPSRHRLPVETSGCCPVA